MKPGCAELSGGVGKHSTQPSGPRCASDHGRGELKVVCIMESFVIWLFCMKMGEADVCVGHL